MLGDSRKELIIEFLGTQIHKKVAGRVLARLPVDDPDLGGAGIPDFLWDDPELGEQACQASPEQQYSS